MSKQLHRPGQQLHAHLVAWWADEHQIPLAAAPEHLPRRASGRRVSVASIYRHTTAGLMGCVLRRFRSGGSWCTTREELVRFQAALTALSEVVA